MINKVSFAIPNYATNRIGFKGKLNPKVEELLKRSTKSEGYHEIDLLFQDLQDENLSKQDIEAIKKAFKEGVNGKPIKPQWGAIYKFFTQE